MRKAKALPEARIWKKEQLAARLNRSGAWLSLNLNLLESEGFPRRDVLLGGWDSLAVERWLDKRSGINEDLGLVRLALERLAREEAEHIQREDSMREFEKQLANGEV